MAVNKILPATTLDVEDEVSWDLRHGEGRSRSTQASSVLLNPKDLFYTNTKCLSIKQFSV